MVPKRMGWIFPAASLERWQAVASRYLLEALEGGYVEWNVNSLAHSRDYFTLASQCEDRHVAWTVRVRLQQPAVGKCGIEEC
jgi:hypothetical protein